LEQDKIDYNFTNNYFTVHGIWPEYKNGSWPSYCDVPKFNITKIEPIKTNLTKYWTNFKDPEKLWKHEYYKHYSCLKSDHLFPNELRFFSIGLELRKALDYYTMLQIESIVPTNKHKYKKEDIINAIRKYIKKEIVITCDKKNILEEIRICFNKNLTLIDCSREEIDKGCYRNEIWFNKYIQ